MNRAALMAFSALASLWLGACTPMVRETSPPAVFDFGPPQPASGSLRFPQLALQVEAPGWLSAPRIDYRLAYEDPFKRRQYTESRWVGAPPALLEQRLRQALGMAGSLETTPSSCLLRVELQEFAQVFETPATSRAVLQARAVLVDSRQRALAERSFQFERPARTADARGGVMALAQAGDEFVTQLAGWLAALQAGSGRGTDACAW